MGWKSRTMRILRPHEHDIVLPPESPFESGKNRSMREDAALSLMDPDTHGYVLFVMKRQPDGSGKITFTSRIDEGWFRPFSKALQRVADVLR